MAVWQVRLAENGVVIGDLTVVRAGREAARPALV
jgi:glycine cleavage system aminomethyltransferase T